MRSGEQTGILTTTDGLELRWRCFPPPGIPRGLVFIVHGLFEHSARYRAVADHLAALGLAVFALDLRGHGESEGRRVHVGDFDAYARDLDAGLRLVRERHPDRPVVLLGHSMGGVVAARYALDHGDELHGLVLSAPGLAPHPSSAPPSWLAALGRMLSRLAPRTLVDAGLDPTKISRDQDVVAAYVADPLIGRKVSARWFTAYEAARRDAMARAHALRVPALVLIAGGDLLVAPQAAAAWAARAPAGLVETRTWDICYHELLNEPERLEVLGAVETWLAEHLPRESP